MYHSFCKLWRRRISDRLSGKCAIYLVKRHMMHGLTTAASLLAVVPIGVAVAIQRYVLAVGVTVLILFVLQGMKQVEKRWGPKATPEE